MHKCWGVEVAVDLQHQRETRGYDLVLCMNCSCIQDKEWNGEGLGHMGRFLVSNGIWEEEM